MIKLMHYADYDYRDPSKHEHRIFPVPAGIRVGVIIKRVKSIANPTKIEVWQYDEKGNAITDLTGFAPHIEGVCLKAYQWLTEHTLSLSGISDTESDAYDSGIVIDGYFQDIRPNYGTADETLDQLEEWLLDEFETTDETKTIFQYLAVTTYESALRGKDGKDIHLRRSNLRHALCASNNADHTRANISVSENVPRFTVWPMSMSPRSWDMSKPGPNAWDSMAGVAAPRGQQFEDQLNTCFERGFIGGLDMRAFHGWNTRVTAYQFITEDATL
ncbi:hypothetical protein ASM1NWU_28 [Enterococcus phage AS-M1_NWU]|nr:hypothetical protein DOUBLEBARREL_46 [Proteus phage vB_PmiS_DoubleBarrel]UXY92195.1 hypothetical protein [Proteus phage RP6]WOL30589.1 hypothetical protein ASM1NWU_28 [Enterococcus phage AS-M1_NWU]